MRDISFKNVYGMGWLLKGKIKHIIFKHLKNALDPFRLKFWQQKKRDINS